WELSFSARNADVPRLKRLSSRRDSFIYSPDIFVAKRAWPHDTTRHERRKSRDSNKSNSARFYQTSLISFDHAALASFACKNFRTAVSLSRRSTAPLSSPSSVLCFKPSM